MRFLFTELSQDALQDGAAFDGVAFGTFRDMFGREIELDPEDAESFVANTQAAIDATTTESGELVGLPIDAHDHDKGDGAGWIVGVELVDGIIRFIPKWTEIGRELIGKGIRRFFSATVDITNKVVLGGTLTNWPATRDENNRVLLRPIELSSNLMALDETPGDIQEANMPKDVEVKQDEPTVETPVTQPSASPPAEMEGNLLAELMEAANKAGASDPGTLAGIVQRTADQMAQRQVAQLLENNHRQWEITELAAKLTGGGAYGLPVKPAELTDFLISLNPDQFDAAKSIFSKITTGGLVEFTEYGHGRRLRKKQLPEVYHSGLKATIDAGNSVNAFFSQFAELGNPDQYDLSQFKGDR